MAFLAHARDIPRRRDRGVGGLGTHVAARMRQRCRIGVGDPVVVAMHARKDLRQCRRKLNQRQVQMLACDAGGRFAPIRLERAGRREDEGDVEPAGPEVDAGDVGRMHTGRCFHMEDGSMSTAVK